MNRTYDPRGMRTNAISFGLASDRLTATQQLACSGKNIRTGKRCTRKPPVDSQTAIRLDCNRFRYCVASSFSLLVEQHGNVERARKPLKLWHSGTIGGSFGTLLAAGVSLKRGIPWDHERR